MAEVEVSEEVEHVAIRQHLDDVVDRLRVEPRLEDRDRPAPGITIIRRSRQESGACEVGAAEGTARCPGAEPLHERAGDHDAVVDVHVLAVVVDPDAEEVEASVEGRGGFSAVFSGILMCRRAKFMPRVIGPAILPESGLLKIP